MGDHAITLLKDTGPGPNQMTPGFDELFSEHHQKVLMSAYRVTGNLADAEDALQSVFLRLLKNRQQLTGSDDPGRYLCRSAINAAIDLLRARKRAPTETLVEETQQSETGAADSEARQREQRKLLRKALLSLEQHAAEVFALRYFEDYSNAQIAELLDITPNSVGVTLHRARAQLQELLGELSGEDR